MDESAIHPLLICKLCSRPFVEPVSTQTGERFCRSCITHILLKNSSSEIGRTNLNSEQQLSKMQNVTPVTEPLVLQMLDQIPVRCTKCGEINIQRGQLGEHENQSCRQASVLCRASLCKCPWVGPREELEKHCEECKFEQIRPALEHIFNENAELKDRIQYLETQLDELKNTKMFEKLDINL
jgi:hypothetical protein